MSKHLQNFNKKKTLELSLFHQESTPKTISLFSHQEIRSNVILNNSGMNYVDLVHYISKHQVQFKKLLILSDQFEQFDIPIVIAHKGFLETKTERIELKRHIGVFEKRTSHGAYIPNFKLIPDGRTVLNIKLLKESKIRIFTEIHEW